MSTMSPVPKDHPLMLAWEAHKKTEEYANSRNWAANPQHVDGSLWALFSAGWQAAQPAQLVDVAGAIRKGFMTAESCGPDNSYVLSIKFGSLDDLQAAHNALVGLTAALQEKGNG